MKKRLQEKRRVSGASLLMDDLNNESTNDSLLDGLPAFQQNKGVMMANFEEWIKMATDNKINTTNSWNFALIDYFHDLNVLREGDNNINFQKASATLDGCVKIYSSRVDSVATETGRLLSGLAARKQMEAEQKGKEVDIEEGDEEDADDSNVDYDENTDEQTDMKKKKSKSNKAMELKNTLVPFESIRVKKLSQELSIDPLFKKTLAEFDEGGAKSLLLNTLNMDNHTRVVFDATKGEQKESIKHEDDDERNHEDEDGDGDEEIEKSKDMEMSGMDEDDIDISVFKDFVIKDDADFDSLTICPSFGHLETVLQDVKKAKSILNDVNQQNISIPGHEEDGPGQDNGLGFDFDFGGGGDYGDDNDDDDSLGNLDNEAAAVLFNDEKDDDEEGDTRIVANVVDHDLMAYFDHTLKRNWAGPEHWKVKQLKKTQAQELKPLLDGTNKKKAPKEAFIIDFMTEMDDEEEDKIFAKSKTSTTLPLDQQESPDSNLLPDDLYFSSEQLVRLFLKPDQKLRIFQRKAKSNSYDQSKPPIIDGVDTTKAEHQDIPDATFWAENYKEQEVKDQDEPSFYQGNDDFDFGGGDDGGFDDDNGGDYLNETKFDFGTQLITGGNKVKPEYVSYSKTAKNVNVKYLKDNLWKAIETKKETEPERNLSDVVQDIGKLYPKEEKKDLSTSFFFICLLHLANEHELTLESNEQLTDLQIKGLIPQ